MACRSRLYSAFLLVSAVAAATVANVHAADVQGVANEETWLIQSHTSTDVRGRLEGVDVVSSDGRGRFVVRSSTGSATADGIRSLCDEFGEHSRRISCRRLESPAEIVVAGVHQRGRRGGAHLRRQDLSSIDSAMFSANLNSVVSLAATRNTEDASATESVINDLQALLESVQGSGSVVLQGPVDAGRGLSSSNVIAEIPGSDPDAGFWVVGAHFDTMPSTGSAPGAEDNGSGVAAILSAYSFLSDFEEQPAASIVFVLFGAEEQGLFGSEHYVDSLSEDERDRLQGAIVLDMVSYASDASARGLLVETSDSNQEFANRMLEATGDFAPSMEQFLSLNPFGSDHMPFIHAGLPVVLLIDNDWDVYSCYHQSCDEISLTVAEQGRDVARIVAGTLLAEAYGDGPAPTPGQVPSSSSASLLPSWGFLALCLQSSIHWIKMR